MLAGVSPDYYTRLEQGRRPTASASVLEALAHALRLSAEERLHLYALAGESAPPATEPLSPAGATDPRLRRVFDLLQGTPALVRGPYLDVIELNAAARFLYPGFSQLPPKERNGVRWMLLSAAAKELYREQWQEAASDFIGMLRIDVGRWPDSPRAREIVGEFTAASALFRRLWTEHQVSDWRAEEKVLYHSVAGPLRFYNSAVGVHGVRDQAIFLLISQDPCAFSAAHRTVWKAAVQNNGTARN